MPTEQVYVLELIVNKIELQPGIRINNVDSLSLGFKFAQLINFEVDTEFFSSPEIEEGTDSRNINMNYGKTFLFIAKPSVLRQLLQTDPYQITLYDGNKTLGTIAVTWKKEFCEMVKFFESLGIVKSTTLEDNFELRNDKHVRTAKVDIFLRLSCFGPNVQTMFQIKKENHKQEYIFRQRNASRIFKVEKYQDGRCQPLVAPLYGAIIDAKKGPSSQINFRENVSLMEIFERDRMAPKESTYHHPEPFACDEGILLDFPDDFDKVSICFRPLENKFFNLLNIISADVRTHEKHTEVTLHKKKVSRVESFLKSVGGDLRSSPNIVIEEEDDDDEDMIEMTADKIAKKLCKNKDCPAAKRFKEYGIGPLATGKSLGTVYGVVEPPVTYGMSHTYGTMCEYGPYGMFARPKQEELPFVPLTEEVDLPPTKPCRNTAHTNKKKRHRDWHSKCCPLYPERLRGGADDIDMLQQQNEAEEEGMVMPKSPIIECRSVMDQFDWILAEYKKALGPCGHATCPYAQTLADATCKKLCEQLPVPTKKTSSISCNDSPCDVDGCPYSEDSKKKRYPAGCGSPKCAYTKYKLGLLDEEAELEMKFLPPPLAGNCGDPQCKYPVAPPLPPIHWDCPDPLPKGPCRNLNCPFQPSSLRKFKTRKQIKTGPCGSPLCPYALPPPCGLPSCPFATRVCSMSQGQTHKQNQKCKLESEVNLCQNPDCPFADKNVKAEISDGVHDSKFKGEFQDCDNPDCPYKKKCRKKNPKKKQRASTCSNQICPFARLEKEDKGRETDKGERDNQSLCSNPECPTRTKENKNERNRCLKSSSSESAKICSDTECPYADLKKGKEKKQNSCYVTEQQYSTDSGGKGGGVSICSNSECPEKLGRGSENLKLCNLPDCPYSKKSSVCNDPNCPYLKPLPSCGVPNCPYEPVPLRVSCRNPKCPSKTVNFSKKGGKGEIRDILENRKEEEPGLGNIPAIEMKTTTVCETLQPCDAQEDCENPDCEMKDGEGTKQGGEVALNNPKRKRKRKNRGKFVYSMGDTYPGTKLGHKECVSPVFNVPPHMGWLWNIFTPMLRMKPRRGWRPGALTKSIAARIRAHRQAKGLGFLRVPTFQKDGRQFDDDDGPKVVPKPTLQIQKKEGTYWITMNPLKDPFGLVENEDPYMECTPMTFKITKNKKPEDEFCYCDGDESPEDISASSSDSELDIEFTPPAGVIHPERFKKRPNVACCEAQYDPKDFQVAKKKGDKKGKGKGGKEGKKSKKGKVGKKKQK